MLAEWIFVLKLISEAISIVLVIVDFMLPESVPFVQLNATVVVVVSWSAGDVKAGWFGATVSINRDRWEYTVSEVSLTAFTFHIYFASSLNKLGSMV